MNPDNR